MGLERIDSSIQDLDHLNTKKPSKRSFGATDSKDGSGTKKRKETHGATDFEADGYEHLETLSDKVRDQLGELAIHRSRLQSPYVLVVRRIQDGERFVAKVNRKPREKRILQLLHGATPGNGHIIPLLGTFYTNMGLAILLPLRKSVADVIGTHALSPARFVQFANGLVEGLAFIHRHQIAHRDIKPDNLVFDESGLQIIDYDIAIELSHADELVDDDAGTEGFRAPETQARSNGSIMPYNPIKADRWSCGKTLNVFANHARPLEAKIRNLASRLLDAVPSRRPSLEECCRILSESTEIVCTNLDAGNRSLQSLLSHKAHPRLVEAH